MKSYFKAGTWNCICDVCGLQFKSDELVKRWDGLMVCETDYETRHPQSLLKVPLERTGVPWARPDGENTVTINFTHSVSETQVVDDSIQRVISYNRSLPVLGISSESLSPLTRPLNSFALNEETFGGAATFTQLNDEYFNITESIIEEEGTPVSDAESTSETTSFSFETSTTDSETTTESVVFSMPTTLILNGDSLNNTVL